MTSKTVATLRQAIQDLHGCDSRWMGSRAVTERFHGDTVWEGQVEVFSLIDHPTANRAYAWTHVTDSVGPRYVAVLHQGQVDSARTAVRAAIVAEAGEDED